MNNVDSTKALKPVTDFGVTPKAELETEYAVLGAMIIEGDVAVKVIPDMNVDYFYDEKNRCVFLAVQELVKNDQKVDMLTVVEQLRRMDLYEKAGCNYHVAMICGVVASAANIQSHINVLNDFYLRRQCITATMKALNEYFEPSSNFTETTYRLVKFLTENLNSMPLMREFISIEKAATESVERLMKRQQTDGKCLIGVSSGFNNLDALISGWQPGTLNILAGRVSEGKTALMLYFLSEAAKTVPTAVVSLEGDAIHLADRMLIGHSDVNSRKWRSGELNSTEIERVNKALDEVKNLYVMFHNTGNITIEEVCHAARSLHAQGKCELLMVDYLQLFRQYGRKGMSREEEVAIYSRSLKMLAIELNIPIIALCQFNRDVSQNPAQIPRKENIRESGAIEQDADTITLIYHPAKAGLDTDPIYHRPVTDDMMMLIVDKNRDGETGVCYLSHNPSFTRFHPYSSENQHPEVKNIREHDGYMMLFEENNP